MPDGIQITVTNLKEVNRDLYRYSQQLGDRVVLAAARRGANIIKRSIQNRVPIRTGEFKRSITVRNSKKYSKRRGGDKLGVYVTLNKKRAFYGRFLNDGYIAGGTRRGGPGRKISGKEYFDRGFKASRQNAVDFFVDAVEAGSEVVKRRTRNLR